MGPIGCPDTSVRNYHYSLRNNSEERSSQDRRKVRVQKIMSADPQNEADLFNCTVNQKTELLYIKAHLVKFSIVMYDYVWRFISGWKCCREGR